jgi:hypothetical protein
MQSQRSSTPQPPSPPDLPDPPDLSGILGITPGVPSGPLTPRQIQQVRDAREELNRHLENIEGRRENILEELSSTGGPAREGLLQRLAVVDNRIARIEADLERTSQAITNGMLPAPEAMTLVPPQSPVDRMPPGGLVAIGVVFTIFVLAPIAFAFARLLWKRATAPRTAQPAWDSGQRMDRLEHAVDAIAVEVERISEGQRFVTRLLTESPNFAALNGAQRSAEPAVQRDPAKAPREER